MHGVERNVGASVNVPIVIRSDMIPQMRLVFYYVNVDGSVIADSLLVGVQERCRHDPTVREPQIFSIKITNYKLTFCP